MLGRLLACRAVGLGEVVFGGSWWSCGRRENRQSLALAGSRHPWRRMELSAFLKMVTLLVSKRTLQPLLQSWPMPKRLCLKVGMMLPLVMGRVESW